MNLKQRIKAKETRIGKLLIVFSIIGELLIETVAELSTLPGLLGEEGNEFIPAPVRNIIRMVAVVGIIAGKLTAANEQPKEGE